MKHKKTYADMERHPGDMTDFRRPAYSVRHPQNGYADTQNMSTGQQNEAKYPENEYRHTHNTSAGKLIRVQAEQIREDPAEYVARKFNIRGDADGQEDS